jgi:ATP phosphoribosyltransferase
MKRNKNNLTIAIQKNGRLTEPSLSLLRGMGLEFEVDARRLLAPCRNFDLDILFLRSGDIPEHVAAGAVDLGVVGENVIFEHGARLRVLERLGFGQCQLMIAAPKASGLRRLRDLRGLRVATTYPRSLKKFLARKKVAASIVEISGSVEAAPALGIADAICDLVATGSTLRVNELVSLETVFSSEAVLAANGAALRRKGAQIERLRMRARSVRTARRAKYIMLNAPASALPRIKRVIPSLKSPTVIPLAEPGMIAVHSVVAEEVLWDVIEKIKRLGGSEILVMSIEKEIP